MYKHIKNQNIYISTLCYICLRLNYKTGEAPSLNGHKTSNLELGIKFSIIVNVDVVDQFL